jgi:hypothetical protein
VEPVNLVTLIPASYKDVVVLTQIIAIDGSSKMLDGVRAVFKRILDELSGEAASGSSDAVTAHVNEHFGEMKKDHLVVREFLRDMYRKLLQDGDISECDSQFIINCIGAGMTTSVSKDGKISFAGNTY